MLLRWLGALCCALVTSAAVADSVSGPVRLAPAADCGSAASVQWTFSWTVNPTREFGRITNAAGAVIGSYDQASPLTGGSFTGVWTQPITSPQPPNTLIGSYGGAGDNPATAANTAEFFILYNCTTKQVIYACNGNLGACPRTAAEGLARASDAIPASSPATLALMLLVLGATGALALRRAGGVRA